MNRRLCIVLHDVAPATWPQCARLLALLDELGAPPATLLIVPDYHGRGGIERDRAFVRAIERQLRKGDELALHGYVHRDDAAAPRTPGAWLRRRVLTAGEGEFAALSCEDARTRIACGLDAFARLGWPVTGFVPPAWLMSTGAYAALRASPLRYTSTHAALVALPGGKRFPAPCLTASTRAPWRRAMSKHWLRLGARAMARARVVRVGLHPADALYAPMRECWKEVIRELLCQREPATKLQALQALIRDVSRAA